MTPRIFTASFLDDKIALGASLPVRQMGLNDRTSVVLVQGEEGFTCHRMNWLNQDSQKKIYFLVRVTDKWRIFMKNQIKMARKFFQEAEKAITELNQASRWPVSKRTFKTDKDMLLMFFKTPMMKANQNFDPHDQNENFSQFSITRLTLLGMAWHGCIRFWASLLLYRKILDELEANDYDNFTKRAYVSKAKKIMALPVAYARSFVRPSRTLSTLVNS